MRLYKTYEKIAIYAYPHHLLVLIKQHKEEIALIFEPYSDTHRHVVEVHLIADLGVNIVTGKQIGRASCRERVSSPV